MKRRAGFTLIELLVYLGIVTVASATMAIFITDVTRAARSNRDDQLVREHLELVISRLAHDIRTASALTIPSVADPNRGQLEIDGSPDTTYSWDAYAVRNVTAAANVTPDTISVTKLRFDQSGNGVAVTVAGGMNTTGDQNNPSHLLEIRTTLIPRRTIYE